MDEVGQATVLDTGLQRLGSIYAKGLLGATERAGNTDAVLAELDSFVDDVLTRLPSLEAALSSPRVPIEAKERLLDSVFKPGSSRELANFVKVLARRGRLNAVRAVRSAAHRLVNELRGRLEVQLTTAEPLDRPTSELIRSKLKDSLGREIELHTHVDPELIGGIVIRIGDTVYDGSIANQLQQLRSELVARAAQTMRSQTDRFAVAN